MGSCKIVSVIGLFVFIVGLIVFVGIYSDWLDQTLLPQALEDPVIQEMSSRALYRNTTQNR